MKFKTVCLLLMVSASIATILAQPVYDNTFCMQRRCPYEGDFRCKGTGNCIRASLICNGRENCEDGSDEENCGPSYYGCRGFLCDNRTKCISHSRVCNGYPSCSDGSDETNCLTEECPFDGDVKCNDTGRCYRSNFICNGFSTCRYGTDEENCGSKPCPYDSDFRCGDGVCIRSNQVCNRFNNCQDGSDEVNCTYGCPNNDDIMCNSRCYDAHQFCYGRQKCSDVHVSLNCSLQSCPYDGDFRCSNGACVRSHDVCNGVCQCSDCSDEENCTSLSCGSSSLKWCPLYNDCRHTFSACVFSDCGYNNASDGSRCFDCRNSTWLGNLVYECDGINDCEDGNDEQNCYQRECFADDDFRCHTTGACIRNVQVCDGQQHCSDNSDEENCLFRNCTIPGDVKCRDSGICIHSDMICNGLNDCMDGSDEENCSARQCPFPGDMRCSSSQACIRSFQWCNNRLDCDDGSDEVHCYDYPCPHAGDFQCHYGGSCIRGDDVCDGTEHCLDGSDEGMNYCPEDFTLGLLWERTLTKTTYEHKCSDIHPSFKFADTITRHCMKNRTWAPVNMSQCVMDNDSPVVMVVIVNMATENSSLVKSKRDLIIQDVKQMIIEHPAVHIDILQSTVNVSLKITYEFSTLNVNELVEVINYEMTITALANISVTTLPQLTVFESTDVCHCPDTMSSSIFPTGVDKVMVEIVSVCSGKPCDNHCSDHSTCKCVHPFVGDGVICGKDSDEDGYPDITLPCDDPHCTQDNCPTVYNPKQNEVCSDKENDTVSTANANVDEDDDDDEDSFGVSAAVGITFTVTLILSILCTLVIVYIVYKIKTKTAKDDSEARDTLSMTSKGSTIKVNETAHDNEDYEFLVNLSNTNRYQSNPIVVMQQHPVNGVTNQTDAIYENAK